MEFGFWTHYAAVFNVEYIINQKMNMYKSVQWSILLSQIRFLWDLYWIGNAPASNKIVIDGTMSVLLIRTPLFNEPSSDEKVKLFEKINLVIYVGLMRLARFLGWRTALYDIGLMYHKRHLIICFLCPTQKSVLHYILNIVMPLDWVIVSKPLCCIAFASIEPCIKLLQRRV